MKRLNKDGTEIFAKLSIHLNPNRKVEDGQWVADYFERNAKAANYTAYGKTPGEAFANSPLSAGIRKRIHYFCEIRVPKNYQEFLDRGGEVCNYPYIQAWGKHMGSFDYYIEAQIEEAREDNAPPTACYKSGGVWTTVEGILSEPVRHLIKKTAKQFM